MGLVSFVLVGVGCFDEGVFDLPVRRPFRVDRTAGASDVDPQGRVSNVAVLSWIADAAVAHSSALGWDHDRYVEIGGFL